MYEFLVNKFNGNKCWQLAAMSFLLLTFILAKSRDFTSSYCNSYFTSSDCNSYFTILFGDRFSVDINSVFQI